MRCVNENRSTIDYSSSSIDVSSKMLIGSDNYNRVAFFLPRLAGDSFGGSCLAPVFLMIRLLGCAQKSLYSLSFGSKLEALIN